VLAANDGKPVRRARATSATTATAGSRGTLTDDNGVFELTELPAETLYVDGVKTGFVTLSWSAAASRRARLGDGQQMDRIEFRLPRGSMIAGRIYDEARRPDAGRVGARHAVSICARRRQLVPARSAQTAMGAPFGCGA
jgi:hypothetical protein